MEEQHLITIVIVVGMTGFEPVAPCSQGRCATKLRYIPETLATMKRQRGPVGTGRKIMLTTYRPIPTVVQSVLSYLLTAGTVRRVTDVDLVQVTDAQAARVAA